MKIENVKGGYNFLPNEQKIRNYINRTLITTFEEYGYKSVETPIITYYDILSDKYDESNDLLNEIYQLSDRGGRKLGLRYDLTVPFAKLIALNKNDIKYPFKRYEIAKVFRDGPVKVGRDREFTQCDVDVVGIGGQLIEAELLSLYVSAFKKLNIEIIIKYNSRNLMTGLIIESDIDKNKVSSVITIIDKINKLSINEIKQLLFELNIPNDSIDKLLKYFNLSLDELNKLFINTNNLELKKGLEELNSLTNYLIELDIIGYTKFDITLARGQDYYTGNVFEVYEKNNKLTSSIGGGGRYDNMISDFIDDGNSYPAVGISFGLTSLYELLTDNNIQNSIDIYIIPINTYIDSLKLANEIRNMGYKVDIEMNDRKLKRSIEYANKECIPYVIILGGDEVKNGQFRLKNMIKGDEYLININCVKNIKKYLW